MKKEIIACDFLNSGKECHRFAESSCAICDKDGCDEHLIMALTLSFSTESPPKVINPNDGAYAAKEPLHPAQAIAHKRQLCLPCSTRVNRILFDRMMEGRRATPSALEEMLKTLIAETKAILAEQTLRAMGEPPR